MKGRCPRFHIILDLLVREIEQLIFLAQPIAPYLAHNLIVEIGIPMRLIPHDEDRADAQIQCMINTIEVICSQLVLAIPITYSTGVHEISIQVHSWPPS